MQLVHDFIVNEESVFFHYRLFHTFHARPQLPKNRS